MPEALKRQNKLWWIERVFMVNSGQYENTKYNIFYNDFISHVIKRPHSSNNLHVFLRHWSTYSWDAFLFIFFSDPNLSQDLEELKMTPHENNYEFKQESNY